MSFQRMKRVVPLFAAGCMLASSSAFAMMGDAGCGLGSLVMPKNTIVSQTLASTTNGTFYTQFFGITSGTSNCKASGFVKVDKKEIFYAESNYTALTFEMAKGEGENLSAFAQVLGCSDKVVPDFGKLTKSKYQAIIPSMKTTPVEMLESLKKEMHSDPILAKECASVG